MYKNKMEVTKLLKKILLWCKEEDWIIVAIPAIILLILLIVANLWFWVGVLSCLILITLFFEWLAIKRTSLSISDQFRTWKKTHRKISILILIVATIFFASLIFHLIVEI